MYLNYGNELFPFEWSVFDSYPIYCTMPIKYFLSLSFKFKSNGNAKKNSQNTEISNFVSSRVLRKLKVYNLPENIFQNMDSLKIL